MKSSFCSSMVVDNIQSSCVRSALPMGVDPEAIVELYLFKYRLKVSSNLIIIFVQHEKFLLCDFSIGCATSVPMGVAPRL
jgi:hypothetical protein